MDEDEEDLTIRGLFVRNPYGRRFVVNLTREEYEAMEESGATPPAVRKRIDAKLARIRAAHGHEDAG